MNTKKNATPGEPTDAALPLEPNDRGDLSMVGEILKLEATWKAVNDGCDVLATMDGKAIGYVNRTIDHTGRERFTVGVGNVKRNARTREDAKGFIERTMRRESLKVGLVLTLVAEQRQG